MPSVYWDCHRALRGSNKGGSVPIVLPGMLKPLSGHRPNPELGVAREAAEGISPHPSYSADKEARQDNCGGLVEGVCGGGGGGGLYGSNINQNLLPVTAVM